MERVVDEVGQHTLDLGRVHLDRRRIRSDLQPDADVSAPRPRAPGHELVDVPQLTVRLDRTGFEPRDVEELLHDPVEPRRLGANRLGELSLSPASSARPGLASASAEARIAVSGERRSWETARRSAS